MHFPTFFTAVLAVPSISTVTEPKPAALRRIAEQDASRLALGLKSSRWRDARRGRHGCGAAQVTPPVIIR